MIKIAGVGKIDVKEIFKKSFKKQTKVLSGIELIESPPFQWDQKDVISCVATSGKIYYSMFVCSMESTLWDSLLHGMNEDWKSADRDAYLQEYINIVCGRAISDINNIVKTSSRFSIPFIKEGEYRIRNVEGMKWEAIYFDNIGGKMKIEFIYQLKQMEYN